MSETVTRSGNIREQLPPLLSAYRSSSAHTFESPVAFQLGLLLEELFIRVLRSVSGCPVIWERFLCVCWAVSPTLHKEHGDKDKAGGLAANLGFLGFPQRGCASLGRESPRGISAPTAPLDRSMGPEPAGNTRARPGEL